MTVNFPEKFSEAEELSFYYTIQKQLDADLEALIDPTKENEAAAARNDALQYMALVTKPKSFLNSPNSYLIAQDKSFEALCCIMEDNGTVNAKALTTYEFFNRSEYCEKKYKAQNT